MHGPTYLKKSIPKFKCSGVENKLCIYPIKRYNTLSYYNSSNCFDLLDNNSQKSFSNSKNLQSSRKSIRTSKSIHSTEKNHQTPLKRKYKNNHTIPH